ncbi:uncharacterized protein LOC131857749 [Cryptomeria japonica]|uniref:uncharacterized protein LOC131857749 n=1 Tax=Cryptomeria japonica TaxID=3369 RepID=UPI0027DA51B7|nr:uncharacterized protein LOC131857749 [Cryptomeria japonica]
MIGKKDEVVKEIEIILRCFLIEQRVDINPVDSSQQKYVPEKKEEGYDPKDTPSILDVSVDVSNGQQEQSSIDPVEQPLVDIVDNQVVDNSSDAIQGLPDIDIIIEMIVEELGEVGKNKDDGLEGEKDNIEDPMKEKVEKQSNNAPKPITNAIIPNKGKQIVVNNDPSHALVDFRTLSPLQALNSATLIQIKANEEEEKQAEKDSFEKFKSKEIPKGVKIIDFELDNKYMQDDSIDTELILIPDDNIKDNVDNTIGNVDVQMFEHHEKQEEQVEKKTEEKSFDEPSDNAQPTDTQIPSEAVTEVKKITIYTRVVKKPQSGGAQQSKNPRDESESFRKARASKQQKYEIDATLKFDKIEGTFDIVPPLTLKELIDELIKDQSVVEEAIRDDVNLKEPTQYASIPEVNIAFLGKPKDQSLEKATPEGQTNDQSHVDNDNTSDVSIQDPLVIEVVSDKVVEESVYVEKDANDGKKDGKVESKKVVSEEKGEEKEDQNSGHSGKRH